MLTVKGSTYHIPVALYFADNHPYSGPYCYVRPTSSMRIRSSQQVDDKGRIYLPYLTEWQYPSHDTTGLLQVRTCSDLLELRTLEIMAVDKDYWSI